MFTYRHALPNLLNDGTRTFTYDTSNRLTSVSTGVTTQFTYNGDGDRMAQIVAGVTTNYALDPAGLAQVLIETTSGQSTSYLPGLAQYRGNTWNYYLPDRLGSVRQLTDPTGAVLLAQSYDPFGNVLARTGSGQSAFGYTGEQTDPTGLVFLRARYYNPYLNRFISPDTIIPNPTQSQSWNRYLYVGNNPVNRTDPSGHCIVQWSGEVRMGQSPYGTSGLCPHTESAPTEAAYAATAMHNDPSIGTTPTEAAVGVGVVAGILIAPEIAIGYGALELAIYSGSAGCLTNPVCANIVFGVGNQAANNVNASTPGGCKGFPIGVAPGTNQGTWINSVWYTGHALDQMQGRGFVPSVVENTIAIGQKWPGKYPDTTIYYDAVNNISVVVNQAGYIITVSYGKLLGQ